MMNANFHSDGFRMTNNPEKPKPLTRLTEPLNPATLDQHEATSAGESPVQDTVEAPKLDYVPKANVNLLSSGDLPLRPYAKPDPTRETAVLSDNNPLMKRLMRSGTTGGTASIGDGREVILVIRGMVERVVMKDARIYRLGRFELATRKEDEIDLSPYGALDRGVSRVHAHLQMSGEHIYITDLTSTNGTYLAGQRLKPNEPTLLRKGDELLIGRLPVQVLFR